MARIRPHLPHPPITEALIDFHTRPSEGTDLEAVQDLAMRTEGYEEKGPIFRFQTTWALTEEKGLTDQSLSQKLGVRLHSPDDKYVLQLRTNGFTISRLTPYENWENLLTEARRLWALYINRLEPVSIVRVATRFINNLKLPMRPGEQFEDYLTKPPSLPKELPQGVLGFTQRIVVAHPELDARANLIQLLQEGVVPADHVAVILDIDVYKMVELQPETEDAWNLLYELRVFKNAAFFASLTEKTVELFE